MRTSSVVWLLDIMVPTIGTSKNKEISQNSWTQSGLKLRSFDQRYTTTYFYKTFTYLF